MTAKSPPVTLRQRLAQHKKIFILVVLLNAAILLIGLLLNRNPSVGKFLQGLEQTTYLLTVARLLLELLIYWHWRRFIGCLRVILRLKNRTTWLVFRLQRVFFWFLLFDASTFVVLTFF